MFNRITVQFSFIWMKIYNKMESPKSKMFLQQMRMITPQEFHTHKTKTLTDCCHFWHDKLEKDSTPTPDMCRPALALPA